MSSYFITTEYKLFENTHEGVYLIGMYGDKGEYNELTFTDKDTAYTEFNSIV